MDATNDRDATKPLPLTFSREHFADYYTALVSRIRATDECDGVFTGYIPHPLIELQSENQQEILDYGISLVAPALLTHRPFEPADELVYSIEQAAARANRDPPLAKLWEDFKTAWPVYKRVQRKIYAIIVATLRVGTSVHYARSVPYGAGMLLLDTIMSDSRQNTTRALFALFASLFTLKMKSGESFEMFKRCFDLIVNRFANWRPPIQLPEQLLLFFVLRGVPEQPFGPTKHIILATEDITLSKGLHLLRDVGQSEVGLITSTLGSGAATNHHKYECLCSRCATTTQNTRTHEPTTP